MISAIGAGREHFRLLDLDLAFNTLGTGSGEALATALRRNETLTRLSVRCEISCGQICQNAVASRECCLSN